MNKLESTQAWGKMAQRDRYLDAKTKLQTETPILVDGGAYIGNTIETFLNQYAAPIIFAFEPSPQSFEILIKKYGESPSIHLFQNALGAQNTSVLFNIVNNQMSSSCFVPSTISTKYHGDRLKVVQQIDVGQIRLDDALTTVTTLDLLKLDLQGYELEALKGSELILQRTRIVMLEIEFTSLYQQQPLFAEVDVFMRNHNFHLFNLYDLWTQEDGQLTAGDALYLNNAYFEHDN